MRDEDKVEEQRPNKTHAIDEELGGRASQTALGHGGPQGPQGSEGRRETA